MAYLCFFLLLALIQASVCRDNTGEDASLSQEDENRSKESHNGWGYNHHNSRSEEVRNRRPNPAQTMMTILSMLFRGAGRQQIRPSILGSQGPQQECNQTSPANLTQKPPVLPLSSHPTENWSLPYRPPGGWGINLVNPSPNMTGSLLFRP